MALPVKGSIVAFITNAWAGNRDLANTYREMGWADYMGTVDKTDDVFLALGRFLCLFCLDEDGVYNDFSHPFEAIMLPVLADRGVGLDTKRLGELRTLMDSGDADEEAVADLLREIQVKAVAHGR